MTNGHVWATIGFFTFPDDKTSTYKINGYIRDCRSNVGSVINPSDIAYITDPNAGVIGILHLMVSLKLVVLLVPDMPAPESTIQFDVATCALFIATGAMNIDISDLSSDSESAAGSGSRPGPNSSDVPGFWICSFLDDFVVDGECAGDVGLYAGDALDLPSVLSSSYELSSCWGFLMNITVGVMGSAFLLRFVLLMRPCITFAPFLRCDSFGLNSFGVVDFTNNSFNSSSMSFHIVTPSNLL